MPHVSARSDSGRCCLLPGKSDWLCITSMGHRRTYGPLTASVYLDHVGIADDQLFFVPLIRRILTYHRERVDLN